jgi:hypothetical protein
MDCDDRGNGGFGRYESCYGTCGGNLADNEHVRCMVGA